jgi:hypothetical protein
MSGELYGDLTFIGDFFIVEAVPKPKIWNGFGCEKFHRKGLL